MGISLQELKWESHFQFNCRHQNGNHTFKSYVTTPKTNFLAHLQFPL
jgi:hypothetical protein